MTPHELNLYIIANRERLKQQQQGQILQAYLGALWGRTKRMPNIKKFIDEDTPQPQAKKVQSPEQMLAVAKQLHVKMTGEEV